MRATPKLAETTPNGMNVPKLVGRFRAKWAETGTGWPYLAIRCHAPPPARAPTDKHIRAQFVAKWGLDMAPLPPPPPSISRNSGSPLKPKFEKQGGPRSSTQDTWGGVGASVERVRKQCWSNAEAIAGQCCRDAGASHKPALEADGKDAVRAHRTSIDPRAPSSNVPRYTQAPEVAAATPPADPPITSPVLRREALESSVSALELILGVAN